MNPNSSSPKALIIGSGPAACYAALQLTQKGIGVILTEAEKDLSIKHHGTTYEAAEICSTLCSGLPNREGIEVLTDTALYECLGGAGNFRVALKQNGNLLARAVDGIIIGIEPKIEPNFAGHLLRRSDVTLSLSEIGSTLHGMSGNKPKVAFLIGLYEDSNIVIMKEVMRRALHVQTELKGQAYIFTNNVKVSGNGLEALYQKTRREGVAYFKFTDTRPEIVQDKGGNVKIKFVDELVSQPFVVAPDFTVVEEIIRPSDSFKKLAQVLRLDTDSDGFLQANNMHRVPVFSNRQGIMIIGPARKIQSIADQLTDAENAVMATVGLLARSTQTMRAKVTIHRGKCTICLTCYRVCPHGAITWDNRAIIMPEACHVCGICAAECPMDAIQLEHFTDEDIIAQIKQGKISGSTTAEEQFIPRIVVFCCEHSGSRALKLAAHMGYPLPFGLQGIEVPCAGKIDPDYIIKSFEHGADGVIIMACHQGNCFSERGNTYAEQRAAIIKEMLNETGLEKDRLIFKHIASNMGIEFFNTVKNVETEIKALGPNPLVRS